MNAPAAPRPSSSSRSAPAPATRRPARRAAPRRCRRGAPREIITFNEKGRHLTHEQRRILARAWNAAVRGLSAGLSFRGFARRMGLCRRTWAAEYALGGGARPVPDLKHPGRRVFGEYDPDLAQARHDWNAAQKGRPMLYTNRIDDEFARLVLDKRRKMSPADARLEIIRLHPDWRIPCLSTFYNHIRNGSSRVKQGQTPRHPGRPKREKARARPCIVAPGRRTIADRPPAAGARSEPGHKELDIVESCVGGTGGVLVLVDRCTRFYQTRKLRRNTRAEVLRAIRAMRRRGELAGVKSVTTDNGTQFLDQAALDKAFGAPVFYTRAYASWEKGSVENANGLLRRWFPKGTDFSLVARRDLSFATECINSIHRRALGGRTAAETTAPCVPSAPPVEKYS